MSDEPMPWDVPSMPPGHAALDLLATRIALVRADGRLRWVNAAFEDSAGMSRRMLLRGNLLDWLEDPSALAEALAAVAQQRIDKAQLEAVLRPSRVSGTDVVPVHAILTQPVPGPYADVLVELIEVEQRERQDREERTLAQMRSDKELIRNLAHEIKNPLGGIRGAAQLLALDLGPQRELQDYTRVIIHEADRLQALVDRLLAPHRRASEIGDVNLHEVCERVRSLVLAEHPQGLQVRRDYDVSLPEFRGDREQLIQAVLNVVQNAAQALLPRMKATRDACIVLRTRAVRQVTLGKQRHRLALELQVQDNGPGVPEAIRERIFQPLVSGREGGFGLGLTLAQSHVERHGGFLACDSSSAGAVFRILLPLP